MGWKQLSTKGVQLAEHPGHKNALQRMGYGPNTLVPLDFETREFDPMNGAGGRVPLLMEEFEKIGLQNSIVIKDFILQTETSRLFTC